MRNTIFSGIAGQYYVAYELARLQYNVAMTVGNAPGVDLLAAKEGCVSSISIQVKTSQHGERMKKGLCGLYWVIGTLKYAGAAQWYALVDMKEDVPDIYFVPTTWIFAYCSKQKKMPYFFIPNQLIENLKLRNNYSWLEKKPPRVPKNLIAK